MGKFNLLRLIMMTMGRHLMILVQQLDNIHDNWVWFRVRICVPQRLQRNMYSTKVLTTANSIVHSLYYPFLVYKGCSQYMESSTCRLSCGAMVFDDDSDVKSSDLFVVVASWLT